MRIWVFDTETTGLDRKLHSIIELACYSFDLHDPKAPTHLFHRYVYPQNLVWDAYCLNLHKDLIPKLLNKDIPYDKNCEIYTEFDKPKAVPKECLFIELLIWYTQLDYRDREGKLAKMVCSGKNFGSFDQQFIENLPRYHSIFKHRSIDPAKDYMLNTDEVPPDLKTCKERAALMGAKFNSLEVSHTAVEDCMDVVELLQFAQTNRNWGGNWV